MRSRELTSSRNGSGTGGSSGSAAAPPQSAVGAGKVSKLTTDLDRKDGGGFLCQRAGGSRPQGGKGIGRPAALEQNTAQTQVGMGVVRTRLQQVAELLLRLIELPQQQQGLGQPEPGHVGPAVAEVGTAPEVRQRPSGSVPSSASPIR